MCAILNTTAQCLALGFQYRVAIMIKKLYLSLVSLSKLLLCCVISDIDNSPRMAPNFAGGEIKVQREKRIYPRSSFIGWWRSSITEARFRLEF